MQRLMKKMGKCHPSNCPTNKEYKDAVKLVILVAALIILVIVIIL